MLNQNEAISQSAKSVSNFNTGHNSMNKMTHVRRKSDLPDNSLNAINPAIYSTSFI